MSIFKKYSFKQVGTLTSKYEKYMGIERDFPKRDNQRILNINEFKNKTTEFYLKLSEDDKEILEDRLVHIIFWLKSEVINQRIVNPTVNEDYTEFHKTLFDKSFWNVEPTTNPVFETDSNERFFNYVMRFFKDDGRCYKQKTLSYMYWVMMKAIQRPMYIRYVNEHYAKELNPIEKLKGRPQIEGEEIVEQYNQVFKMAQNKWNEENLIYKKSFEAIFHVL